MSNPLLPESQRHKVGLTALVFGYFLYLISFILFNGDFGLPENPAMFATIDCIGFLVQALGFAYSWRYRYKVDKQNRLNNIAFWLYISHLAVIVAWVLLIVILISTGNFQS